MNLELIVGRVESAERKFVLQPDGTIGFGGVARSNRVGLRDHVTQV